MKKIVIQHTIAACCHIAKMKSMKLYLCIGACICVFVAVDVGVGVGVSLFVYLFDFSSFLVHRSSRTVETSSVPSGGELMSKTHGKTVHNRSDEEKSPMSVIHSFSFKTCCLYVRCQSHDRTVAINFIQIISAGLFSFRIAYSKKHKLKLGICVVHHRWRIHLFVISVNDIANFAKLNFISLIITSIWSLNRGK